MYIWIKCPCGFLKSCLHSWSSFVSERCHQEIDKVLQDDEVVTYDARNQMPYMQVCVEKQVSCWSETQKEASEKEKAF